MRCICLHDCFVSTVLCINKTVKNSFKQTTVYGTLLVRAMYGKETGNYDVSNIYRYILLRYTIRPLTFSISLEH